MQFNIYWEHTFRTWGIRDWEDRMTMANTTGSEKRPIFMLCTEGKSKEQLKAEAREALRKYQEAQQQEK
jgi:hypothetical protein